MSSSAIIFGFLNICTRKEFLEGLNTDEKVGVPAKTTFQQIASWTIV